MLLAGYEEEMNRKFRNKLNLSGQKVQSVFNELINQGFSREDVHTILVHTPSILGKAIDTIRGQLGLYRTIFAEKYREVLLTNPRRLIQGYDKTLLFVSLRPPLQCYRVDFGESAQSTAGRGSRPGPRPKEQVAEGPILECLRQEARKLVPEAAPDNPVVFAPALIVQEPLWRAGERRLSTQEIWERLRKDRDLPMVLRPQDILPTFRAGLFASPDVLWYYYDESSKKTFTRENANDLSPVLSLSHFLYEPRAALEDRILSPALITPGEFWEYVWPRENGAPAGHFTAGKILEQIRQSNYFRVLPASDVIWQTVREGVRENRWVLYLPGSGLAFGARELPDWPSSPLLDQTAWLWEYQAALEAGIYPRRGEKQGGAPEISAAVLKARCWPLGAEQINAPALERAAREIWPDLGRPRFTELLEEGTRLGLWGLWVKDAQETYCTSEDSLSEVAVGDNLFLVVPDSPLARRLDVYRPGQKPQPLSATGTPREVMITLWGKLSTQRNIVIEAIVLEVNSREALDGTIAATWPDRPANTRSQCRLLVDAERSTSVTEQLKLEYAGRFEESRSFLAPAWPFAQGGVLDFTVVVTHTFNPPLSVDDPELAAYRDALVNANQGLLTGKVIPARTVSY